MVYKVIDDETALEIYENIQAHSKRSFRAYNRTRQLPKHRISGEVAFYLDELLDFAQNELHQDPAETLATVIDAGIVAWYGNLDRALLEKLGMNKVGGKGAAPSENTASTSPSEPVREGESEQLRDENQSLKAELEQLRQESSEMRREISRLQIANDELSEQVAATGDGTPVSMQPAYLNDDAHQSRYTEMTAHLLASNGRGETKGAKPAKKSKQSRRRR